MTLDQQREVIQERMATRPWKTDKSYNGPGSTKRRTAALVKALPEIVRRFAPNGLVNDAGCGLIDDWIIQPLVDIAETLPDGKSIDYVGYEVCHVEVWILMPTHHAASFRFFIDDITKHKMRKCELIICRDVLIHLPTELIQAALRLFRKSGEYLLAERYLCHDNELVSIDRIQTRIDLSDKPFNLGEPVWKMKDDENGWLREMAVWPLRRV